MGDVVFCCAHCKDSLIVDDRGIGLQLPCPRCQAPIEIPPTAIPSDLVQQLVLTEEVGPLPPGWRFTGLPANPDRAEDASLLPPPAELNSHSGARLPSRSGLFAGLSMLGLIVVGLVLALYVQARIGFTPPEAFVPPSVSPVPPVIARLGEPVRAGLAEVEVQGAQWSGDGNLEVEVRLRNAGQEPLRLGYLWCDVELRDNQARVWRAQGAEPDRETQNRTELAPAQSLVSRMRFPALPADSQSFILRGSPGLWRAEGEEWVEAAQPGFVFSLRRDEIRR
jgi:hypothetical protein